MKLKPNIITQPLGDRLLVLDLDGNVYFSLNESARFMLESLLKGLSPEQTAKDAESLFLASYDDILNDIHEFMDTLKNENLIDNPNT